MKGGNHDDKHVVKRVCMSTKRVSYTSRKRMDSKKRNPFFRDTLNYLGKGGLEFHWSKSYWHYKGLIE